MHNVTDCKNLKTQLRRELPKDVFRARPTRGFLFIPILGSIIGLSVGLIQWNGPWYLLLPLAILLGQLYGINGFLGHEVLHGSVVKSKTLQNLLGYIAFSPFLISPHLWRVWHNQIHHGYTNIGNRDPDSYGTLERYERHPSTRFVTRLAPGSGKWYSYFFLFYWFTFHGQIVLWIQTRFMKAFRHFGARRSKIESTLFFIAWTAAAALLGIEKALFVIVIPLAVGNFVLMSYIATNHFMRPQTKTNDPIENSMSITTHPIIDWFHLNFSYHVEHHLFPKMNPYHAPKIRALLIKKIGKRYVAPPHWKALLYLYLTPRVYKDADTLIDPDNLERTSSIEDITHALAAPSTNQPPHFST